ncbi:hypothetical protein HRbin36_02012 [bacterium HR36]|nr:hypothetical protein HRbin36_02012 [bacterium HR36]
MYYLLTGRPPCSGGNLDEIFAAIRAGDILPIQQLRPDTPKDLLAICGKCLQLVPGARYQSAAELAAELRRFLTGEPLVGPVAERAYRFRLWFRHPARIRDAGVVLTSLSAAFALWCMLGLLLLATGVLQPPSPAALFWHIALWLGFGYVPSLVAGIFILLHRYWALCAGLALTGTGLMLMLADLCGWYHSSYDMGGLIGDRRVVLVVNLLITTLFALAFLIQIPAWRAWHALYRPRARRQHLPR